uniref:Rabaptin coiled-coil domain-containing protein n=1 Tax=Pavo cristatus TaxID=9049 RepID=A0A8C9L8U1_PAVCR
INQDLKRQNAVLQAAQDDLGQLRTQLMEAHAEMENIKAIATVSENTKQEAIDEVKRQWQEEVASLQAIMKETVRDYELQYHHRMEQERAQWNQYRENVEREIAELRRRLSEGQEEENLENEMKKAQEDAEKLRSVVMPMEKEIAALKEKLMEAEEKIKEAQSTDSLGTSGSLQSKALGYNNKAKSAGNLDESDFGPLVGADSVSENYDTASLGSLQMPSGFMLTKDQEKAIKAMTPEQEETASLLSSVTQGVESAYVSPSGYRLVSETEWNLLQKEVSAHRDIYWGLCMECDLETSNQDMHSTRTTSSRLVLMLCQLRYG